MKQLTVKISGSGNIEAAPKDDADINISGSGNVRLLSRPAPPQQPCRGLRAHHPGLGRLGRGKGPALAGSP